SPARPVAASKPKRPSFAMNRLMPLTSIRRPRSKSRARGATGPEASPGPHRHSSPQSITANSKAARNGGLIEQLRELESKPATRPASRLEDMAVLSHDPSTRSGAGHGILKRRESDRSHGFTGPWSGAGLS